MTRTVSCPTCGRKVEWKDTSPWRPFCSERCKLIDLGEWASESYRIHSEETPPSAESAPKPTPSRE